MIPDLFASWSINTRLCMPWFYWNQGMTALGLYLVICLLLLSVFLSARETSYPIWTVLVSIAVLMQFLPHSPGGVQLIPLFPWSYWGRWISFSFSILSWILLFFSVVVLADDNPGSRSECGTLLSIVFVITVLLTPSYPYSDKPMDKPFQIAGTASDAVPDPVHGEALTLEIRLQQCRDQLDLTRGCLQELRNDRRKVSKAMEEVRSTGDPYGTSAKTIQTLEEELQELDFTIQSMDKASDWMRAKILSAESKLRRIQRFQRVTSRATLSTQESLDLTAIQADLDELLRQKIDLPESVLKVIADHALGKTRPLQQAGK